MSLNESRAKRAPPPIIRPCGSDSRPALLNPLRAIVSTFRKVSTEVDQAHRAVITDILTAHYFLTHRRHLNMLLKLAEIPLRT